MSNLAQWSAIVAFFVPVVVALISQPKWPAWLKAGLFFVVALVAAGGTAYFQGDLTGKRFLDAALIVVAAGAAYYHGLYKPTGVAPTIEAKSALK